MKMRDVQFVRGVAAWSGLPDDGLPEVAFIGRSNVGKSSLINLITGRRALARTSGTPGKTRELNFYRVDDRFYLVDLPGFGYAKVARTERERWQRLIGRYLTERPTLRAIFHLIDSRHPPTALDREIMLLAHESTAPYLVVLTKTDKLSGNGRQRAVAEVRRALSAAGREAAILLTSAVDGRGREEVLRWIDDLVDG
ncbi:MAG: putative GTP-binding protein EngB [Rhodothermaceae bacterium]|nr:MAG: putative GTP-binding protein EngB [Rhodothermaceae bacterium]